MRVEKLFLVLLLLAASAFAEGGYTNHAGNVVAGWLFTPEGVRNGIGKMLVGKFLDVKGGLRLTDSELNKISKKFAPIIKAKISDEDIAAARRVNKAEPFQTIQSNCKKWYNASAILRKES